MYTPTSVDVHGRPRPLEIVAFLVLTLWASGALGQTLLQEDFATPEVGRALSGWT